MTLKTASQCVCGIQKATFKAFNNVVIKQWSKFTFVKCDMMRPRVYVRKCVPPVWESVSERICALNLEAVCWFSLEFLLLKRSRAAPRRPDPDYTH